MKPKLFHSLPTFLFPHHPSVNGILHNVTMKPSRLAIYYLLSAVETYVGSLLDWSWLQAKRMYPYGVAFGFAAILGIVFRIWDISNTPMGPALGRYFAKRALEEKAFSAYCVNPRYTQEVDARFDPSSTTWQFTYFVTEPGFEGTKIYATIDKYEKYWLSGSDSLYKLQPQMRHWFGKCRSQEE